jgi:flagellar protein FliS
MFGSTQGGANAYAKVGMETGVLSASPHSLIVMLFDGAIAAVVSALQHMKAGNVPAKGQAISKAIMIIDEGMRASLDKKVGGELALSLDSLYEYMSNRLLLANLKNNPQLLEEVQQLLRDLRGAWNAIGTQVGTAAATTAAQSELPPPQAPTYDGLASRTSKLVKA